MTSKQQPNFWLELLKKILKIILKNAGLYRHDISNNQHVVPHENGWAIKGEGNSKYTAIYERQKDAIKRAKEIASNYKSDVIIHRKDGTIRDRLNYQ